MNFGVAFFGICGMAAVGILDELESMGLCPKALFLNDNSILPVYLHTCGLKREIIMEKCQTIRSFSLDKKKRKIDLTQDMKKMRPQGKIYFSTDSGDYTTDPDLFLNVRNIRTVYDGLDEMIHTYGQSCSESDLPQTWPLTNMGCERILLVSPYCCRTDYKCNLHIRLPAYDRKAMEDLELSYFQGYRAAEHEKARIYEELLF